MRAADSEIQPTFVGPSNRQVMVPVHLMRVHCSCAADNPPLNTTGTMTIRPWTPPPQ